MNVKDICTDARLTLENALKQTRERHAELFSKCVSLATFRQLPLTLCYRAHGGRVPTFAKKEIELAFAFAETKTLATHLLEARTRLRSLLSRCEKLPAQRPRGLSTETPRSHLPLEVIQYIISLAYEGERQAYTRDGDELDFRDYPVAMGATSLGTDVHPMHKALLSSTLICFSDLGHGIFRRAKTPRLKNVSESKYRIAFGSATTTPDATRIVEHLARRITSLVVRTGSQLKCCAASIPYITEFIYLCGTSHPKAYEPDFAWLRAAVQRSEKRSIRIASVPSTLLTDFVSTGLFDGVNDLCVDHNPKVFARTSLLGITELLDTICHCDKLVSLELRLQGYFEYVGMGSRRPISILEWTESDVRGRLPPLRSLNLSGNNWYELQRLIWKFSFCDLTELAFTSFLKESFLGDPSLFCLNLSASFPNLEIFRMTTVRARFWSAFYNWR